MADSGTDLRVAKNTVILVTLRVVIPLLSVALMLVLSRKLGAEGVGRYTLGYSFLHLMNTVGPLGLYAVITRDGARDHNALEKMLSNAFLLGSASSVLLTGLMIFLGQALGYDEATRNALVLLSLAILPYTLGNFIEGASVAIQRTEFIAGATLVEYVIKVGIGVVLLYQGYGLDAVLLMAVIGRTLGCVVGALFLRRAGVRVKWGYDTEMLRKLVRLAPTFLAIGIVATLYWRVDILMLSKLATIEQVGLYGAAYRLLEFAMVVPVSLCLAVYPQMAILMDQDLQRLQRLADTALRYLFAIALPVAIAVTLLAEDLLALLFGESFRSAATTLRVLIWTLVPFCVVRYHAYVLLAAHHQRIDLLVNSIMLAINIVLNALLIPAYGPTGAAVATLIAVVCYGFVQYGYLRHYLPGREATLTLQRIVVVASLTTGAAIWLMQHAHPLLAMAVSPLLYLALLLGGGFVTRSELELVGLQRLAARGPLAAWLKS